MSSKGFKGLTHPGFKVKVRVDFDSNEPVQPLPRNTRFRATLLDLNTEDPKAKVLAERDFDLSGKRITPADPLIFKLIPKQPLNIISFRYAIQAVTTVGWETASNGRSSVRSGDYLNLVHESLTEDRLDGKDTSVLPLKLAVFSETTSR